MVTAHVASCNRAPTASRHRRQTCIQHGECSTQRQGGGGGCWKVHPLAGGTRVSGAGAHQATVEQVRLSGCGIPVFRAALPEECLQLQGPPAAQRQNLLQDWKRKARPVGRRLARHPGWKYRSKGMAKGAECRAKGSAAQHAARQAQTPKRCSLGRALSLHVIVRACQLHFLRPKRSRQSRSHQVYTHESHPQRPTHSGLGRTRNCCTRSYTVRCGCEVDTVPAASPPALPLLP